MSEKELQIAVVDGSVTPLFLSVDVEGETALYTTLNPVEVVDILLSISQAVLRGDLVPKNMQEPDEQPT